MEKDSLKESLKLCSKCYTYKVSEEFSGCRATPSKLQYYCKQCNLYHQRERKAKKKLKRLGMFVKCYQCRESKSLEDFYRNGELLDDCTKCAQVLEKRYRNGREPDFSLLVVRKFPSSFSGKKCSKCGCWKELIDYYQARGSEDGLFDLCKSCCITYPVTDDLFKKNKDHYAYYFGYNSEINLGKKIRENYE